MHIDAALRARAHRQHGLLTVSDWTASGQSDDSFWRARRSGVLVDLGPGVAALAGTPLGPLQRITAAVLSVGPGAWPSHTSGAWLWGAPVVGDDPVHLIGSSAGPQRSARRGVVIHRPDDRDRLHTMVRYGLPVTPPGRTLLDVGAVQPDVVVDVLESFVRAGHLTLANAVDVLRLGRRRGRPGVAALEAALDLIAERGVITDSEFETVMRELFRRGSVDGWVYHDVIEGYEVDFSFPAERVIVEVDGWDVHALDRRRWDGDKIKDLDLAGRGWHVVRLTWRMVTRLPDWTVAHIEQIRAARRPLVALPAER